MRSCIKVELHTRSYNQEAERKYPKLFLRVKIAENVSHEFETKLCCAVTLTCVTSIPTTKKLSSQQRAWTRVDAKK